jgi:mono/diheme cytochrome c family protein
MTAARPAKLLSSAALLLACAGLLGACGTAGVKVARSSPDYAGAVIFKEHCSGCHSLKVVGAEGSATAIANRLRTQGPNFNKRKEIYANILYAIHNGGFSGAIMPENIVVGQQAEAVAKFLAAYSGEEAQKVVSTQIKLSTK